MKYLYITHLSGKRVNRLWISALVAARSLGYEVHLACNMNEIVKNDWDSDCRQYGITAHQVDFDRNPLASGNRKAYSQLIKLMEGEKFDLVHCNTPVGGLLGRLCAQKEKIPYVIYQAHGFHFWKGAPLKNWIFYYPIERYLAQYTDMLITINQEDFSVGKKFRFKKDGKVEYVPGVGVDIEKIAGVQISKEQKKRELGIPNESTVFITVGELIPRKNHAMLIHAFAKAKLMNAMLLICGTGSEAEKLQRQIQEENIDGRVMLLGFRKDVAELLKMADVFVLPSFQEGLPVVLMEAMAVGMPCMASKIRGNVDLLGETYEYLFEPKDAKALAGLIPKISKDKEKTGGYCFDRIKAFNVLKAIPNLKQNYGGKLEKRELQRVIRRQTLRKSMGIPLDALVFVSVGELNDNKNQIVALKAFARARISNSYYLLCGEGPQRENIQSWAEKNKMSDKVRLLGFCGDVLEMLNISDIFVFPSKREGLSVSLMEAMAVGMPCMASKIRGNVDLLGQEYKYLFAPNDVETISNMLRSIQYEKGMCTAISLSNIKKYDFNVVKNELVQIYRRVENKIK